MHNIWLYIKKAQTVDRFGLKIVSFINIYISLSSDIYISHVLPDAIIMFDNMIQSYEGMIKHYDCVTD